MRVWVQSLGPVILLASLAAAVTARQPSRAPVQVSTDAGPVIGASDGAIAVFKGIPYAQPPLGALRWKAPQPVKSWTAPRQATTFGAACPQKAPVDTVDGSTAVLGEDCLTLNLWAPAGSGRPAPVMVWIHGGGNSEGASFRRYYDGTAFARDGVVLVSLNYRLGLLGFFAHPALTHEASADEALGNFVLLDQLAALRWVNHNIAAFGGDPSNITVFGESAGGTDILDLMTIGSAAGLFQRAIVESAGFFPFSVPLARAEADGVRLAAAAGLGGSPTAARLRALPMADLAQLPAGGDGPIVDGRLLATSPVAAFATGRVLHVPLLIGTNSDEGSLRNEAVPPTEVFAGFTPPELAAARAAYGGTLDDATLARALFRDLNFAAPSRWVAEIMSRVAPTFLYRFSYLRRSQRSGAVPGASHGSEIPYVFNSWAQAPGGGALLPAEDRAEAVRVHACWVVFARTGTPSCGEAAGWPAWPRYAAASDQLMDLGVTTAVSPTPNRAVLTLLERRFVPTAGAPSGPR
jgi:para-nitrobenzyl esterase